MSYKLTTSFSSFSIFSLSGRFGFCVNLVGIEYKVQRSILPHFLHYSFYKAFIKSRSIFKLHLKICYYKLFTSQCLRYDDSLFLLSSFIYLLVAFTYLLTDWHILPLNPFSTIKNLSISVNNFNFILVFFKTTYQANAGAERNLAGSSL